MTRAIFFISLLVSFLFAIAQSDIDKIYTAYNGTDLGLTYSPTASTFRIWSPVAEKAQLIIYKEGIGGLPVSVIDMHKSVAGTWTASLKGNNKGRFYVFHVMINGKW